MRQHTNGPVRFRWIAAILATASILVTGCAAVAADPNSAPSTASDQANPGQLAAIPVPGDAEGPYPVVRVADGDTLSIRKDGQVLKVRLLGVDTPESVDPRKPVQCFGIEASNRAKEALTDKQVMIQTDPSQDTYDRYGRLLAYVWVDGQLFQFEQIAQGFGHEYTYADPYRYQSEFRAAERYARDHELGLWSSSACDGVTN